MIRYSMKTGLLLFFFLATAAASYGVNFVVEASSLNVRSCPSRRCKVIGKLSQGDTVNVLKYQNSWAVIQYKEDTEAYVAKKYLKMVIPPKAAKDTSYTREPMIPVVEFSFDGMFRRSLPIFIVVLATLILTDIFIFYFKK